MLNWIGYDYATLVAKLQERLPYGYEIFKDLYPPIFNAYDGSRPSPHEGCLQSSDNILKAFHSGNTVFVLSKSKGNFTEFLNSLCAIVYKYMRKTLMCFI
ncbi:hypothetical protein TNCT_644311 [Trichonephila clavata]|uniref:Uncharacterized protein n=1 Tax=Trichonephila clavata TaxID=2740835 RepID=A0A8X6I238_TRICU|nr:hypothetical protein TNCT_644311 [Trichonephila clavata]